MRRKTDIEIIHSLMNCMKNQELDFNIHQISKETNLNWETTKHFFEVFLAVGLIEESLLKKKFRYLKSNTYWRNLYLSQVRQNGALKVIIQENNYLQR